MGSPLRVHKLVHLLTLASTVSALSLANFQIIISNAIPSTCIRAYSHPIHGCFVRDFTGGSLCSSKCTNGLLKAEAKIDAACKGVDVNRDTLLGVALRGDLIATLCPGVIVAPPSTTVTVTVPARTTTQSSTTTTLPLPPAQTTTQTTPSTLSTSTTAAGTTTATTSPRSTSVPETTSTSTSTSTPSSVDSTTTAPPPPPSATPTDVNTPLPQTTATEPSRPNGGGRPPLIGGGGSPFDQPVIGSGRSTYTVCWTEAIWAALGATAIILC